MKLKDFLGRVVENKRNGQLNTNFKQKKLRECGISTIDLLNMDIKMRNKLK